MNVPSSQEAQIRFVPIYKACVDWANNHQVPYIELAHGTKVLSNGEECIKYTALYGGHHFHKLYAAYASTKFEDIEGGKIEIIDWGCGQALATCVLVDYLIEKNINLDVSSIILIEPSKIALEWGIELVQQMFQNKVSTDCVLQMVNKYIDDLTPTDLISDPDSFKIHLFSNILDVEGFDLGQLYQLMVESFHGINLIIYILWYPPRF